MSTKEKYAQAAEKVRKRAKELREFTVKEARYEKYTRISPDCTKAEFTREYEDKKLRIEIIKTDRLDKHLKDGFHYIIRKVI